MFIFIFLTAFKAHLSAGKMLDKLPWGRGIGTLEIDRVTNQRAGELPDDSGRRLIVQQYFQKGIRTKSMSLFMLTFFLLSFLLSFFLFIFIFSFFIFVIPRFRILVDFRHPSFPPLRGLGSSFW